MNTVSSAIAVLFPGVRTSDIVNAANTNGVSVLLKEPYDPQKNYHRFHKNLRPVISDDGIGLLFIFSDGSSMYGFDRRSISKIMNKVTELQGCVL
ncbi:MAG: hypothetical protein H6551_13435 [Chitinophagales bacterium]|nr:hypothetical protein [Chitinophagaceae bacterium]MCB9066136.1 hypothetical protein [Chitinophagales bacterium]